MPNCLLTIIVLSVITITKDSVQTRSSRDSGCFIDIPVATRMWTAKLHSGCFVDIPVATRMWTAKFHFGCFNDIPVATRMWTQNDISVCSIYIPVATHMWTAKEFGLSHLQSMWSADGLQKNFGINVTCRVAASYWL